MYTVLSLYGYLDCELRFWWLRSDTVRRRTSYLVGRVCNTIGYKQDDAGNYAADLADIDGEHTLKLLNIYETIASVATDELGAVKDCKFPLLVQSQPPIHIQDKFRLRHYSSSHVR